MYALGVDLGTSKTAAAVWRDGRAEAVALGDDAPEPLARGFKRTFGEATPPRSETGQPTGQLTGRLTGRPTAEDLTAHLLEWVVRTVAEREGEAPSRVVVTVPATWRDHRGELMGGLVERVLTAAGLPPGTGSLLPEPAAAAVYHAGRHRLPTGSTIAVCDLGGGSFDATVLRKTSVGFEILGTPATNALGGVDLDHALLRRVAAVLGPALTALDRQDPAVRRGLALLEQDVVRAKEQLSWDEAAVVPVVLPGAVPQVSLHRADLEADLAPTLDAAVEVLEHAVELAGIALGSVNTVLLVGGSCRIPSLPRALAEHLGRPVTVEDHPTYAVCLGAAIAAGAGMAGGVRAGALAGIGALAGRRRSGAPQPAAHASPAAYASPAAHAPPAAHTTPYTPPSEAAPALVVDLAGSGLSGAEEVPLRPAVELRRTPPGGPAQPLEARLRAGRQWPAAPRRGLAKLLTVILLALATVAILVLIFG